MPITTKTGDDGKSRWLDKVVDKDSCLLEAVGTLDELQALVGIIRIKAANKWKINDPTLAIERDLWKIMGELAYCQKFENVVERIELIEKDIKELEDRLPRQTEFIMPGVNEIEAYLNWARTVTRRAERKLVKYNKKDQSVDRNILIYINRLSDYLFILGRTETR